MTTLVVVRPGDPSSDLALEAAVRLRAGEVVAVAIGSREQEPALRAAVAVGANRAIRLAHLGGEVASAAGDAALMVPLVGRLEPEVILLGGRRGKLGTYGAGSALAELSGVPHIGSVASFQRASQDRLEVQRRRQGQLERISCPLPAVLSIEWGAPLRYPTLPGRLRARRTEIEVIAAERPPESPVGLARRTGPKPRRKLEQRTGPGFDHVLGLLLGGAGGGEGGQQLAGDPEEVATRVVAACNRVMGRA